MGYSENLCQICGVSFNIARIRVPAEPRSAAWQTHGEGFVDAEGTFTQCGRDSGCTIVDRQLDEDVLRDPWEKTKNDEEEEGESEGDNEEFASNAENDVDEPDLDEFEDVMNLEHIAGPHCNNTNGYAGHRLTLAEMQHTRTFQALVRKPEDHSEFHPAPDDAPFEHSQPFFLSGLHDGMIETEMSLEMRVYPVRHGVEGPDVTNGMIESSYIDVKGCSMPFHPWCLEVFMRASKNVTGSVDLEGIWGWYEHEADFELFNNFPRNGPTRELAQQWWDHKNGTEWIVCSPLYMPNLAAALSTTISKDETFDVGQGAFDIPQDQLERNSTHEPFEILPTELRLMILHNLSSQDIASLRLSSRAFRQLPISLWHHLLRKEMPWFWEADSTSDLTTYSFWTTTSATELKNNPIPPCDRHPVPIPDLLDPTRTNWHLLYLLLKNRNDDAGHRALRGLRNRERIWRDCEEILRRIQTYRERGEIPVEDVAKIVRERYEETRRKNAEKYGGPGP